MEEFSNFSKYIASIEPQARYYGVCKIIPPKEWSPRARPLDINQLDFVINTPIKQYVEGAKGIYHTLNEECESMTIGEFRKMIRDPNLFLQPPARASVSNASADAQNNTASATSPTTRRSSRLAAKQQNQTQPIFTGKYPPITEEEVDEIERKYWKNLLFFPAMYGADTPGTLFDNHHCKTWNLNNLGTFLQETLRRKLIMPGINTPYLYIGMFKSTFAWHCEDLELHSINYLHFGAPKTWYVIPPSHADKFDALAQSLFPDRYKQCSQFLRHKIIIMSPTVLKEHNIPVCRLTQEENEFMITFPRAYHAGFNHDFNCAESVNFGSAVWLPYGKAADVCQCDKDTARIDMTMFDGLTDEEFAPVGDNFYKNMTPCIPNGSHLLDEYGNLNLYVTPIMLPESYMAASPAPIVHPEALAALAAAPPRKMSKKMAKALEENQEYTPPLKLKVKLSSAETTPNQTAIASAEEKSETTEHQTSPSSDPLVAPVTLKAPEVVLDVKLPEQPPAQTRGSIRDVIQRKMAQQDNFIDTPKTDPAVELESLTKRQMKQKKEKQPKKEGKKKSKGVKKSSKTKEPAGETAPSKPGAPIMMVSSSLSSPPQGLQKKKHKHPLFAAFFGGKMKK